jgi:DNA mismatch endonuclease (patch repair protein)
MVDVFPAAKRSEIMSRVRGRGNHATELRLIVLLRKFRVSGWRRRIPVFGSPDFVFPTYRLAVFVDGCFWHGCPTHGTVPSTNDEFWRAKLKRNQARDRLVNHTLKSSGWSILRIWQHELAVANEARLIRRLQAAICRASAIASASPTFNRRSRSKRGAVKKLVGH